MTSSWCNSCSDNRSPSSSAALIVTTKPQPGTGSVRTCPSCGHKIQIDDQKGGGDSAAVAATNIQDLPGLPAGVKFDPTDQELLEHLEGKSKPDSHTHHPLLDEFIPTLEGENGICYTHPEKLPGVSRDGLIRHFFHRPSKAYTTGTRKRRKVHTDVHGGETRWHKTGKTRPVLVRGKVKGYKKILVLYTNYGKQKKPEKTNWVMHQYHLGSDEEEKDGELVVSKVFYQTQPRQCSGSGSGSRDVVVPQIDHHQQMMKSTVVIKDANTINVDYYNNPGLMSYNQGGAGHLMPNFSVHAAGGPSFLQ